jgi:hypothetical protein
MKLGVRRACLCLQAQQPSSGRSRLVSDTVYIRRRLCLQICLPLLPDFCDVNLLPRSPILRRVVEICRSALLRESIPSRNVASIVPQVLILSELDLELVHFVLSIRRRIYLFVTRPEIEILESCVDRRHLVVVLFCGRSVCIELDTGFLHHIERRKRLAITGRVAKSTARHQFTVGVRRG